MPVLVRIAFRNMWEHKAKSLIIGVLVALGVVVIVLGNSMMDASAEGIRESFIESTTGDLMIHGPSDNPVSIFGVESMSMDADTRIPTVPEYTAVLDKVRADPRVAAATSMCSAYGMVSWGDEDDQPTEDEDEEVSHEDQQKQLRFAILFGVEPTSYFDMFKSIQLKDGRFLAPRETGIMLSSTQMEGLGKRYKRTFALGDVITVTGYGTAGMRIRELPIVGTYDRIEEGSDNAPIAIVDVDTARVIAGLTLGTDEAIELDASQTALLSASSDDDIFGGDDMIEAAAAGSAPVAEDAASLLGDTSRRELLNQADQGAWNFIMVRLKDSGQVAAVTADLKAWLSAEAIDARITDWKGAAGTYGKFADWIRVVFNVALVIIAVVAVIIMMNTLVVSVIERTAEIGTMRALGAKKGFVRSMFLTETLTITFFFGLVGSVIALAATLVVNLLGIKTDNEMLMLLFGGAQLALKPRIGSFVATIAMVFIVGWLAHLYPVAVALKIQPVKAMQAE